MCWHKYPERKAILNFHEYLLASGGLGEEPQRIYDEVVSKNENVCMVLSGHYHNAKTRIDTFTNADGSQEKCTICCLIIRDLWKEEPDI